MVFFPYFSHTGQDMMLRYMITLLLCNELLRITQHGARDHILVLLRCSLALLPRMLKVIYYMEDFHVHAVMIQQWLLLKFCNVNSAYYLSGTQKKKRQAWPHQVHKNTLANSSSSTDINIHGFHGHVQFPCVKDMNTKSACTTFHWTR